ncbi:MAG: ABC transporter permease [Ktedonobacteraceae bacterium]
MHIRNILAIARKDALDILLNKTTLYFLLSPIFLAVLFAVIGGLLSNRAASSSILIYNPGHSGVEQFISSVISSTGPVTHANSAQDVATAFGPQGSHKNVTYVLGVVVPADFDSSVRAGNHPQLQLYLNGDYVGSNDQQLVEHAISDYVRNVTNPQTPVTFSVISVNPPVVNNYVQDYTSRYAMAGLLYSLTIGIAFVPHLLVEEKEKKTMRMLMVSPASWGDIVLGKLLVGLVYQLAISFLVLLIQGGFIGQVPLVLLFLLLGSSFGLVVGLFFGSICQTNGNVGVFVGLVSFAYTLPSLVLGPLYIILQGSPLEQATKVLPTYYMADGILKAMQNQASPDNLLLDIVILVGCIVMLFFAAIWALRRQSALLGAI